MYLVRIARLIVTLSALSLLIMVAGCSDSDDNPVEPAVPDTLYVDPSHPAPGSGTQADPYNSLTAAIAAANAIDVLHLAAGLYDTLETFPIYLKPGLSLIGQGGLFTIVNGPLRDTTASSAVIALYGIQFDELEFTRRAIGARPAEDASFNLVRQCRVVGGLYFRHGGNHHVKVDSSTIFGSVTFDHGPGSSSDIIRFCSIQGEIRFASDDGAYETAYGNYLIGSMLFLSEETNVVVGQNQIINGQIIDRSGSGAHVLRDNFVTFTPGIFNDDSAAVVLDGDQIWLRHNEIVAYGGASGILVTADADVYVDSNSISAVGAVGVHFTPTIGRIINNTISDAAVGIFSRGGAYLVSENSISACSTGIDASDSARYIDNMITNCLGDGFINNGVKGPIEGNTIADCGGTGYRHVSGAADLGGGAQGSNGGNAFRDNADFDVINASGTPLWATNNYWNHSDSASIDNFDIYDDDESVTAGPVNFMPIAQ